MKSGRTLIISLILAVALFLAIFYARLHEKGKMVESTRFLMGTVVQIKIPVGPRDDEAIVRQAIDKAFDEIRRVEAVFSVFREDSEASRINRLKAGEKLRLSGEAYGLIKRSVEYNKKTEGVFDITIKPLVDLWASHKKYETLPTEIEIKEAMAKVGSRYIVLDDSDKAISFKKEGLSLDLGGVAKGYATDRAISILKKSGVTNAIVNSGGDMYCLGRKSARELWKVGIQHPRKKAEVFLELHLENRAIDTSGDYEKYFLLNGKRYSHIIDPRTGYPIGDNTVSATVIADDSTTADILATALAILGPDGLKIVNGMNPVRNYTKTRVSNGMKGVEAMVIFMENGQLKVDMTKGFKGL